MIGIVDDNSLFYAAQTLKQLAKYDEGKKILPLCSIKDYPDVLFRGTVEGFYGQLGATPTVSSKSAFTEGSS